MRASPYAVDFAAVGTERRARVVKSTQDSAAAIDSSGLCMFTRSVWSLDDYAAQIDAACGGGWSGERLRETGERIYNLERRFNNLAGFEVGDDRLPVRFMTEPARTGKAEGWVSKLDELLPEYYAERGWDATGAPTGETLKRLKLI